MKKKYTFRQFIYQIYVKIVIAIIALILMNPCMHLIIKNITESEHKDNFYKAHYTDEPEIFFSSIFELKNEKEVK